MTYSNHSISFEVPENWSVIKDIQEENDTQIVLSDGTSAVRIDLIRLDLNKLIGDYINYHVSKADLSSFDTKNMTGDTWRLAYERFPICSNEAIGDYYMENIIRPIALTGNNYHGSEISVKPDGVEYTQYFTNEYSPQRHSDVSVFEWIIAWTKPDYNNEIMGVHSAFKDDFREVEVGSVGSNTELNMPQPLWTVLNTINRGDKPLQKPATGSSLVDLV